MPTSIEDRGYKCRKLAASLFIVPSGFLPPPLSSSASPCMGFTRLGGQAVEAPRRSERAFMSARRFMYSDSHSYIHTHPYEWRYAHQAISQMTKRDLIAQVAEGIRCCKATWCFREYCNFSYFSAGFSRRCLTSCWLTMSTKLSRVFVVGLFRNVRIFLSKITQS